MAGIGTFSNIPVDIMGIFGFVLASLKSGCAMFELSQKYFSPPPTQEK